MNRPFHLSTNPLQSRGKNPLSGACLYYAAIALVIAAACITSPASAGEKYLYGAPELSATIAGTNEFAPGDELAVTVSVENRGLNAVKIVQSDIVNRDDLPNTAKLVRASLAGGEAPLVVKTDAQMIGDISGGASAQAAFQLAFDEDAEPGVYTLPLTIQYTYLREAEQYGTDTIRYDYRTTEEVIPLNVRIKPDVTLAVGEISTDSVNVGTEGYLTVTVENTGSQKAASAVLHIGRNGESPIIPTDSSVYIGDFVPGETAECTYKVSVSGNAESQVYPLDVYLDYENADGDQVTSDPVTFGVQVGGKIAFDVIPSENRVNPGEKHVIEVQYRNTGGATAYSAQARLSAVDPFSSNDDTAFLGDLAPGETATARFEVSCDGGATAKTYGLDSEIRYRDSLDNSQISDTMKVKIQVDEPEGALDSLPLSALLGVLAVGCVGSAWCFLRFRKKE
jgi:hypothetical protein